MRRLIGTLIVGLLSAGWGVAQAAAPAPAAASPAALPAAQGMIIERTLNRISFNSDGSGTREATAAFRIQSDSAVQELAVLTFPYVASLQSVTVVYVRVQQPDGTVVVTPAANVEDMPEPVSSAAPMYSDIREKHVVVRGLTVGSLLEYDVRTQMLKSELPGQFWADYDFPTAFIAKDEELDISVPSGTAINLASPGLTPQVSHDGNRTTYVWKTSNAAPAATAPADAGHLPPPSVALSTFKSWAALGAWFDGLVQPQAVVTPAIRAKAAALTAGLSTDHAKVQALYHFVSTQIHYVSLSFGAGLYQPHPADAVLQNGYGDCKDKYTLLAALLQAAGYQSWPALINSSRQILAQVPSPAQFDHVITVVPLGAASPTEVDWLDTTAEVAPYGLLLPVLRDKPALVMPAGQPAALRTTPANPPFPSTVDFDAQAKLGPDGTLTAHITQRFRGDLGVVARLSFRAVAPAQWPTLAQIMLKGEGLDGHASNVHVSPPDDTTAPFQLSVDYEDKVDDQDWAAHRIDPPLPPDLQIASDTAPTKPVNLGAPTTITYHAQIQLPSGYDAPPFPPVDLDDSYLSYRARYGLQNGVYTIDRVWANKVNQLPVSAWGEYRKFDDAVNADQRAWITLKPLQDGTPSALVRSGIDALNAQDFTQAADRFQQAVKLQPRDSKVWAYLGAAYLGQHDLSHARAAFQTEVGINPGNFRAQDGLASVDLMGGQIDAALAQIRQERSLNPTDVNARSLLGKILLFKKDYAEAVPELVAAAASVDSAAVELELGASYLELGDKTKAMTALEQAASQNPSSGQMSEIARLLANQGVDLDQVHQLATAALTSIEGQLHDVSADSMNQQQAAEQAVLAGGWGTLGWIDLQQGDLADAQDYLAAGWSLDQDPETADHLGRLYQKQGRKADAERWFADALATGGPAPADARTRLRALAGPGADALINQEREAVSRVRMIEIPHQQLPNGTAHFLIGFGPGPKVVGVHFVAGDAPLRAAAGALAAAKFNIKMPRGSVATVVVQGILDCEPSAAACDFVLVPELVIPQL